MRMIVRALGTALIGSSLLMASPTMAEVDITTVNGVATYPEGYQGRPHRAPNEEPRSPPTSLASG